MGFSVIIVTVFTSIWAFVGIILPLVVPKGPNKGIIQSMLMLSAFTCWLFWLCCYMAQMNPLIGPILTNNTVAIMAREWGNPIKAG